MNVYAKLKEKALLLILQNKTKQKQHRADKLLKTVFK